MSSERRPSPGKYAKGAARRQEILDRAIEVFARRGSQRTSLRAIATEVGVTHAALTHYFGSLEELLVEVYREASRQNAEERPASPAETPIEIMRQSARLNREVPGLVELYSVLVATGLQEGHPAARTFAQDRFEKLRHDLAERVRGNQRAGRMRADVDPEAVAALVIAASDGLQTQWLLEERVDEQGALTLLEQLLSSPEADAGHH